MLLGAGTGQTRLSYDEEVDFGRRQVELMTRSALAADVERLGLTGIRDEIHEVTEALARGLGRGPGESRAASRRQRIRAALVVCATTFNSIHSQIAWFIEHTPAGEARVRLERMLSPLQALLARYHRSAGVNGAEEEETPSPAPEPAPAPAPSPAPSPAPAVTPAVA